MLRRRQQDHRRGALWHVGADLVEERTAQLRPGPLLGDAAGQAAADHPCGKPRRTERSPGHRARQRPLDGLASDELLVVVRVHISAGELAAHDDPVAAVMLDERDLLRPRDPFHLRGRIRIGALGSFSMREHHQCEIEACGLHCDRTLRRLRL